MKASVKASRLRAIPSVEKVLQALGDTPLPRPIVVDVVRREQRQAPVAAPDPETAAQDFEELFDERDHWREHPHEWDTPEAALQQKEFRQVLESCLSHLPRRTVQAFLLREQMGREIEEICRDLGLSAANCSVLLHRSRMALRLCLQKNWFRA